MTGEQSPGNAAESGHKPTAKKGWFSMTNTKEELRRRIFTMRKYLAILLLSVLCFVAGIAATVAEAMPEQSAVVSYFNGLIVKEYFNP